MLVICFLIILVLLVTQVVLVPLVRLVLIGPLAPIRRRLATKVHIFFDIYNFFRRKEKDYRKTAGFFI